MKSALARRPTCHSALPERNGAPGRVERPHLAGGPADNALTCRTVATALEAATFHLPSVVVVDVAMEDGKGWEVVQPHNRRRTNDSVFAR